jgi:hypothetical protein
MCHINLLELLVVKVSFGLLPIRFNVALDFQLDRAGIDLLEQCTAELLEEIVQGVIEAEPILKGLFLLHSIILSEEIHILLELGHIIY